MSGGDNDTSGRGGGCPDNISCPLDMRRLSYTTKDGRELDACEDPCDDDLACPKGLECESVVDRPSKICR